MDPSPKDARTKPKIQPTIGIIPKIDRVINPSKNNQKVCALDKLNFFWKKNPISVETIIFEM